MNKKFLEEAKNWKPTFNGKPLTGAQVAMIMETVRFKYEYETAEEYQAYRDDFHKRMQDAFNS